MVAPSSVRLSTVSTSAYVGFRHKSEVVWGTLEGSSSLRGHEQKTISTIPDFSWCQYRAFLKPSKMKACVNLDSRWQTKFSKFWQTLQFKAMYLPGKLLEPRTETSMNSNLVFAQVRAQASPCTPTPPPLISSLTSEINDTEIPQT